MSLSIHCCCRFPTQHCRRIIWIFFWLRIFEDLSYWAHESQCLFCSSLSTVDLSVLEEGFLPSDHPEPLKANHFLTVLEDTGSAQRRVMDLGLIFMKSNLLSAKYSGRFCEEGCCYGLWQLQLCLDLPLSYRVFSSAVFWYISVPATSQCIQHTHWGFLNAGAKFYNELSVIVGMDTWSSSLFIADWFSNHITVFFSFLAIPLLY